MICFNGGTPHGNSTCHCPPSTYGLFCTYKCLKGEWDPINLTCLCQTGFSRVPCDLPKGNSNWASSLGAFCFVLVFFICLPATVCLFGSKIYRLCCPRTSRATNRGRYDPQTQFYEVSEEPDTLVIYCAQNEESGINHVVLTRMIRHRSDTDRNAEIVVEDKPPEYETLFENNRLPTYEEARNMENIDTEIEYCTVV